MQTIFINIPSPIAIRNFFLIPGGLLGILKKQTDLKIVALAVEQAANEVRRDFGSENVIIEPVKVSWKKTRFQALATFITSYLNFTELARLEATMGVRIDVPTAGGRKYLYLLKVLIKNTLGRISFFRIKVAPKIDMLANPERPYKYLFEKHKPSLVFGTDIFGAQDIVLLREARRQKVRSIGMTSSWDHFPKRFEPVKPDILLVWNEVLKKEAMELQNYDKKNIFVVGVPQYDLFVKKDLLLSRKELFKRFNFDENKKLISFFSSSKRAPDDGDIVDMILRWINEEKFSVSAQLFLRPYPGVVTDHDKFDRFQGKRNVYIDWVEIKRIFGTASHSWYPSLDSIVQSASVFSHSDIVVSTYSSASIEAAAFLKPNININFDGYKDRPFCQSIKRSKYKSHFKHVLETGGARQAENQNDLFNLLDEFLKNLEANRENIKKLRDKMCWKIDGRASERIAQHILKNI